MSDIERVKKNPGHIAYVENQTEQLCLEAVTRNGMTLYYVKDPTESVIRAAIKQNPHALNFIENPTTEHCKLAVSEDGMAIQFVEKKTPEICLLAVRQNGAALSFVPKEMRSNELILEAIKQDPSVLQLIDNQTEEQCLLAISVNPKMIAYVKNQTGNIIKSVLNKATPEMMQAFIDFKRFRISSIQSVETGETYVLETVPQNSNAVPQPQVKLFPAFSNENRKLIYIEDIRKNKIMYVNNATSIQDEIEKYIQHRYGKKCLEKALHYFLKKETMDNIKNDTTFDEGVFFVKLDDNNYEMYKKVTTYHKAGWWSGKSQESTIEKIRIYKVLVLEE